MNSLHPATAHGILSIHSESVMAAMVKFLYGMMCGDIRMFG
jgi:hypothetical protein